ncbi:MAG: peroxiredoxin family protein [Anaerolineae bacterium]|nr:peroxiredoxin family protein [Anaerolineae bacterium]
MDLQQDSAFQALDVALVSIAFDSIQELQAGMAEYNISGVPMLRDTDHSVAEAYTVLQWAARTGEPGHTFVLVDQDGMVRWIGDYGAPQNGGLMYVPVEELDTQIRDRLKTQ